MKNTYRFVYTRKAKKFVQAIRPIVKESGSSITIHRSDCVVKISMLDAEDQGLFDQIDEIADTHLHLPIFL